MQSDRKSRGPIQHHNIRARIEPHHKQHHQPQQHQFHPPAHRPHTGPEGPFQVHQHQDRADQQKNVQQPLMCTVSDHQAGSPRRQFQRAPQLLLFLAHRLHRCHLTLRRMCFARHDETAGCPHHIVAPTQNRTPIRIGNFQPPRTTDA